MDRELIRRRLIELRLVRYPDLATFARAARIPHSNVMAIEESGTFGLKNIEKWVTACGSSLSQFFKEIEALERGDTSAREHDLLLETKALIAEDDELASELAEVLRRLRGSKRRLRLLSR